MIRALIGWSLFWLASPFLFYQYMKWRAMVRKKCNSLVKQYGLEVAARYRQTQPTSFFQWSREVFIHGF